MYPSFRFFQLPPSRIHFFAPRLGHPSLLLPAGLQIM
jgi:hypothetical protein